MSDILIGPNRCSCGGEYGQHSKGCPNRPKSAKKRNPQDATVQRNIAPLRRRIEKNEAEIKALKAELKIIKKSVTRLVYKSLDI